MTNDQFVQSYPHIKPVHKFEEKLSPFDIFPVATTVLAVGLVLAFISLIAIQLYY